MDYITATAVQARSTIPPQAVSLVPTGTVLPLSVLINGIPAVNNCSQTPDRTSGVQTTTTKTTAAPGLRTYGEADTLAAPVCEGFVFSAALGPSIAGSIMPSTANKSDTVLVVPLLAPASTTAADLVVNIGGKFCRNLVLFLEVNSTTPGANGTAATDVVVIGEPLERAAAVKLRCTAPQLPAGKT